MAKEIERKVFIVECFGDNGGWLEVVFAEDEKTAKNKCELVFGKYHKKFETYIWNEHDAYIE